MTRFTRPRTPNRTGFTLVELLAAISILSVLMIVIFAIYNQASRAWLAGENRAETFQGVRVVLETMGRELEGAMAGTNAASGGMLTFLSQANPGFLPSGAIPASLEEAEPNDELFFVSAAPDSYGQSFADLTEYGYFVVYCKADYGTMAGGYYYLIRHAVPSTSSGWDIFTNPLDWNITPTGIGDSPTAKRQPILDNVLRLEFRFQARDPSTNHLHGTTIVEEWNANPLCPDAGLGAGCVSCNRAPLLGIANPMIQLPRAVHIRLATIDRRSAGRLKDLIDANGWTTGIIEAELRKVIPNCADETIEDIGNEPLKTLLRESVRIFYKTVHLRNYRDAAY